MCWGPWQPSAPEVGPQWQDVVDRCWAEIMAACDAYFLRGETAWAGDSRAPQWPDEIVERQIAYYDGYRGDTGAMNWAENRGKSLAYDFTALPLGMKRAICERQWAIGESSGLFRDPAWLEKVRRARELTKRDTPSP